MGRSPDAVQPKHVGSAPTLQPSSRIPHGGGDGCPAGLTNIFCGIPIASDDVPIGSAGDTARRQALIRQDPAERLVARHDPKGTAPAVFSDQHIGAGCGLSRHRAGEDIADLSSRRGAAGRSSPASMDGGSATVSRRTSEMTGRPMEQMEDGHVGEVWNGTREE